MTEHMASFTAPAQAAVVWASRWLDANGLRGSGVIEHVRSMPWSTVMRLHSWDGWLYLKVPAPIFAVDGPVMMFLGRSLHGPVPGVLAHHLSTGAFLMPDIGYPLRETLLERMDPDLLYSVLHRYGTMQVAAASHADHLLALGVPDWRNSRLPFLLEDLLDSGLLQQTEGMDEVEVAHMKQWIPEVCGLCDALDLLGIAPSVEHADFQDNNVFIRGGHVLVSDFSDAVLAHPFFSLTRFLDSFKRVHGANATPVLLKDMTDAYLSAWSGLHSQADIEEAFELVGRLGSIKYALGFSRLWRGLPHEGLVRYHGWMADGLRTFGHRAR
jgi:aminoglycoside/choline kinase family phosphotransferase